MQNEKSRPHIQVWMAVIFLISSLIFMTVSILFIYRKPTIRRFNNDRIIKKAIALSLLEVEHPIQPITISNSEFNDEKYWQKSMEQHVDEYFSHIKKLSQLTGSDYKKIKKLYISDPNVYDISLLSKLTNLEKLELYNVNVSNLDPISNLTNIQELRLRKVRVSSLEPLAKLTNLKILQIYEMPLSDIDPLGNLTKLEEVRMYAVRVKNLEALSNLKNMKELFISNVPVGKEQVYELQKALPNVQINR